MTLTIVIQTWETAKEFFNNEKSQLSVSKTASDCFCHDFNKKLNLIKCTLRSTINKTITKDFSDKNQENINIDNIWLIQWNVPEAGKHSQPW